MAVIFNPQVAIEWLETQENHYAAIRKYDVARACGEVVDALKAAIKHPNHDEPRSDQIKDPGGPYTVAQMSNTQHAVVYKDQRLMTAHSEMSESVCRFWVGQLNTAYHRGCADGTSPAHPNHDDAIVKAAEKFYDDYEDRSVSINQYEMSRVLLLQTVAAKRAAQPAVMRAGCK